MDFEESYPLPLVANQPLDELMGVPPGFTAQLPVSCIDPGETEFLEGDELVAEEGVELVGVFVQSLPQRGQPIKIMRQLRYLSLQRHLYTFLAFQQTLTQLQLTAGLRQAVLFIGSLIAIILNFVTSVRSSLVARSSLLPLSDELEGVALEEKAKHEEKEKCDGGEKGETATQIHFYFCQISQQHNNSNQFANLEKLQFAEQHESWPNLPHCL